MKTPSLFDRPPFDGDQYIKDREAAINDEKSPIIIARVHELQAQGKSYTNQFKEKYDIASPVDQMKMVGFKSGKAGKITTQAEEKAKRESRFAEDNIVGKWAKWFKQTYPGVKHVIDRKAQRKSKIRATIEAAQDAQRGNPDIHVQIQRGGFGGLYIEQKKSDDIFYKGTRILKPGSDNRELWQALYHAYLRDNGFWVMFSISLEASIKMTERYMAGNPYPMQVFEYKCKAKDVPIFQDNPYFKPIELL